MPSLIRLYITQTIIGFALAGAFVAMLLWFNVANLWHLVTHTSGGLIAVAMLVVANGIVFAGVQFAITIMRMAETDDTPGGGTRAPVTSGEPALVKVAAGRKAPFRK